MLSSGSDISTWLLAIDFSRFRVDGRLTRNSALIGGLAISLGILASSGDV